MIRTHPESELVPRALYLDGIAAAHLGRADVLEWVRGRLKEKDPERLAKLDRKTARVRSD
jgi:hypothetical protein